MKGALVCAVLVCCGSAASAQRERLREVKRWAYQLQGPMPHPGPSVDCIVIDADGGDGGPPVADRVRSLQRRPGKPDRIVLAYLSIGEAEDYRAYWQPTWNKQPPAFLAPENKQWHGNFKVRYWDPQWQAIVLASLDQILAAGFDGVYLDIIDAFEYFGPEGPRPERKTAAEDMSQLVLKLARHARAGRPAFLVVPQNGASLPGLLGHAGGATYLQAIDAIGAEDTFYFGHRRENNALNVQTETLAALARFRDAGKPVLSVEYVTDPAKIARFVELAREHRFVPCVARRALDKLVELGE